MQFSTCTIYKPEPIEFQGEVSWLTLALLLETATKPHLKILYHGSYIFNTLFQNVVFWILLQLLQLSQAATQKVTFADVSTTNYLVTSFFSQSSNMKAFNFQGQAITVQVRQLLHAYA